MPTTLLRSLRRPVTRLKPGEVCTWERHLRWGTAARSLWRQLNNLDSVKKDGVCYATIVRLQKKSAKFRGGKKVGTYDYDRLRHLLREFEGAGLVGPSYEEDEGEYAGMLVFQVHGQHMHDQLCGREGSTCRYLGWNYAAWLAKSKGQVADNVAGQVAGQVAGKVAALPEKCSRTGSRLEMPQDMQNDKLQETPKSENASSRAPKHLNQSVMGSKEAGESVESATNGEEKAIATAKPFPSSLTDQNQNPRPCVTDQKRHEKINGHFDGSVSIEEISDGEIDPDEIDKYGLRNDWRKIEECCQGAVAAKADLPYLGRKTNGDLMATAMVLLKDRYGQDAPKCWYPVIKTLRESKLEPALVESRGLNSTFDWAVHSSGIDLSAHMEVLAKAPKGMQGAAAGWYWIHSLPGTLPERLANLRDWLWEKDATEGKPAIAPWSGK